MGSARGVVAAYRPLLEPLGLTHPQYLVMVSLWQHGPQTVKQLGTLLALDSGTVSPLLKRLESAGLLSRARDPEDERSLRLTLTAEGRTLRDHALAIPPAIMARLGLDAAQLGVLHAQLTEVIARTEPGDTGDTSSSAVSVDAST